MLLFSHWLFLLKNWRFSANSCNAFIVSLMMNIRNLGSNESVGVQFKEGICAQLCLKSWFGSDWYFCNFTKQDGFENDRKKS